MQCDMTCSEVHKNLHFTVLFIYCFGGGVQYDMTRSDCEVYKNLHFTVLKQQAKGRRRLMQYI